MKNRKEKDVVIPGAEGNWEATIKQGKMTSLTAGLPVHAGNDSKRAFTLIELLVVVLIIGILSAIALPQYQKAVLRTKYVQLMTIGDAIHKAEETYYLANGQYTNNADELDIQIPASTKYSFDLDVRNTGDSKGHAAMTVFLANQYIYYVIYFDKHNGYSREGKRYCRVSPGGSDMEREVCKNLTGSQGIDQGVYLEYLFQ